MEVTGSKAKAAIFGLLVISALAGAILYGIASEQPRLDVKIRHRVLALIQNGKLEEARRAIADLGSPDAAPAADLWAQYYLKRVMTLPPSEASVNAANAIRPDHIEYTIARRYIHAYIEFSVKAIDGDPGQLGPLIADAEAALWSGDGGRQITILLSTVRANTCLRQEEWPCVEDESAHLSALGEHTQSDQIRRRAIARLRRNVDSAMQCGEDDCEACLTRAIDSLSRLEAFTHSPPPALGALRAKRTAISTAHRAAHGHRARNAGCVVASGRIEAGRSRTVPLPFPTN
jgi:hypothetical protein